MGGTESRSREENGEATESSDTALANQSSPTSALATAAVTGMAILALGVGVVSMMDELSQPSEEEKTMKAPGRTFAYPGLTSRTTPKPTSRTCGEANGRSSRWLATK
ncbi:hypothetical protein ACJRO7_031966 [Eucalyptus globulus]|uniref:Uncharacterized protein n=1 Tax=Eucalyptus globulus TaxID=34317 RepID=A0ABD3JHV6_EUCGL